MTKKQIPNEDDLFEALDFRIWTLFVVCYLYFGIYEP